MITENLHLNTFMQIFNLNALTETPTSYQSHNPTCIYNILQIKKDYLSYKRYFKLDY